MKNHLLQHNLLPEQKEINKQLEKSYNQIIIFLKKLAISLERYELQGVIEIDHAHNPESIATIYECITPYFIISLGADETGYYNIAYSLDYRTKEMIGEYALSSLLRTIYKLTMIGYTEIGIEHRVRVHDLCLDVITIYKRIRG